MSSKQYIVSILLSLTISVSGVNIAHTTMEGVDSVPASFFREWYHRSDLVYYLEALNDHTIVENLTTGQWWLPDRLSIAVDGLPCTNNRYYIDGFRVDDRFLAGHTRYAPNMEQYNLTINIHSGQFFFDHDSTARDYVQASYNFGQVGNGAPAAGTTEIINLFHRSAVQSADTYKHISARRHQKGAGTIDAAYTFRDKKGNGYRQHLYAAYGQRLITKQDQCGLIVDAPFYTAPYYIVQADGYLPMKPNSVFNRLGYRLNFSGRSDAGSEHFFNHNEVYGHKNYAGSIYAKRAYLTTGLTWESNVTRHENFAFRRNIIDQDGESFEPWVPDGKTHFLSWAVNYEQPVLPWLSVFVDAYNSLVLFRPDSKQWSNTLYLQSPIASTPTDIYRYEWTSNAFTAGLLENTVGLKAHYDIAKWIAVNGHIDLTLDGLLLDHSQSKVSPHAQAGANFDIHPCSWFEIGLTADYNRLPYTMDYLRFFSADYLNGDIYYAGTNILAGKTGGQYHHYKKNLLQTSYIEVNIPIRFHAFDKQGGQHEIVLQNSYKKFFNVWYTTAAADGFEVGYTPPFGSNGLMNSPYFFSQLSRYTYTGKKVMLSFAWQSMQAAGYVGLGNGPTSNTLGILSESTAKPTTTEVVNNSKGQYPGVSRMDLDKGFVARFYLSYNICKWVQAGFTFKWTDGKPFTAYRYYLNNQTIDGQQVTDVTIRPLSSRGTNPTDGNFGTRNNAIFMCDLHVQARWEVKSIAMRLRLEAYNVWDFSNDIGEINFFQDIPHAERVSHILNVPTGLLATYSIEL